METITRTNEMRAVKLKNDENQEGGSMRAILSNRDFRLLWAGEAISVLGDQFYMIALPWLVLQLTGDALAMGTVLATAGIPRALFMLLGGAITDRFSPRTVMLGSNMVRMLLVSLLALLVLLGSAQLWMLYLFALAFGLADAFFYPAQSAIVPRIVDSKHLQSANALVQGTAQLSLFAGPVLAGVLIAMLGSSQVVDGETVADMQGIGIAMAIDSVTFLASALTLWRMSPGRDEVVGDIKEKATSMLASMREGLVNVWEDKVLRYYFLLIAVSNLLVNGPFIVGIPVLADTRFDEGAVAFGMIMSAYGGGSLLGTITAMVLPKPQDRRLGVVLGVIWSGLGIGVLLLGLISSALIAAAVGLVMGAANGYVVIIFITWLQERTPQHMLGRVMSLLMFASVGLIPVSTALTGMFINWNATALFVGAGAAMTIIVLLTLTSPTMRTMSVAPAGATD